MLAQALVRRDLFPNSDFLKVKDRIPTLMQEVLHYAPDVACLQEVDRLSDHLPSLTLTHSYTSFIGYKDKSHGLLVAHKNSVFTKVGERGIRLDELPIDESAPAPATSFDVPSEVEDVLPTPSEDTKTPSGEGEAAGAEVKEEGYDPNSSEVKAKRKAAGLSRTTRNVALFVALKFKDREGGIIIATTHLFWHPAHVYERSRQTGILLRELRRFRDEGGNGEWVNWPTFLAGDLNTQPCEITYRLVMRLSLTPEQEGGLERSTVVHHSVEKLYDPQWEAPPEPEPAQDGIHDGDLSQHPDRIIAHSRPGTEADGLASLEAIKKLFGYGEDDASSQIRSAYGEAYGKIPSESSQWYCQRTPEVHSGSGWATQQDPKVVEARQAGEWEERVRRGDFEPIWTNFTPLWRCTLDYIFLLPPSKLATNEKAAPRFTALLRTHSTETMGLGLPRKGIEPSDHVSIAAVVDIPE
ncbi:Endonuclease [Pseudohyphozyma bogoriensis]|nr:Endonuclease [Pseudohyphozyma bogoriensis]